MGRAERVGDNVAGRWVVLGSTRRREGRVVHVRDRTWSGVRLSWWPRPPGVTLEDFDAGARAWLALPPHPGILAGYGPRWMGDDQIALTDHAPGPTLSGFLAEHALPLDRALGWGARLADAVRVLHDVGIVHGAVDAESCIVDTAGELRLGSLPLGAPGHPAPGYGAPEGAGTEAADVYGLAAVIYRLVTGFEPFGPSEAARHAWRQHLGRSSSSWARLSRWIFGAPTASMPGELFDRLERPADAEDDDPGRLVALMQQHCEALAPSARGITLPDGVEPVLLAALDRDPAGRPASAELARALVAVAPLPADPIEARTETLAALAHLDLGMEAEAVARLEAQVARDPDAVHAWIDLQVLRITAGDEAAFEVRRQFEQQVEGRRQRRWDEALDGFATTLQRRVLGLGGAVRGASIRPDGKAVALVGAFPSGGRTWDTDDRGGTGPIRLPAPHADGARHLSDGSLVVRLGPTLIRVDRSGSRPLWSVPLDGVPVALDVYGDEVLVGVTDALIVLHAASGVVRRRVAVPGLTSIAAGRVGVVVGTREGARWLEDDAWLVRGEVRAVAVDGGAVVVATEGGLHRIAGAGAARLEAPGEVRLLAAAGGYVLAAGGAPEGVSPEAWLLSGDTGELLRRLPSPGEITAVALGPSASFALVTDAEGWARRWPLEGERWPLAVPDLDEWLAGSMLQREVGEGTLLRQEGSSGVLLGVLGVKKDWSAAYGFPVAALAFDADNTRLAVACERTVHVSRVAGRTVHLDVQTLSCNAPVRGVAFSPDARRLAAGLGEGVSVDTPSPGEVRQGARLTVQEADGVTFSVPVGPGGLTVGRAPDRDLVIADAKVSRRHCSVQWIGGRCVVRDDGSANGFLVNGERAWEAVLEEGDTIRLGSVLLTYTVEADETGSVTEPASPERDVAGEPETPTLMMRVSDLPDLTELPVGRADVAVVWSTAKRGAPTVLPGHRGAVRAVAFRGDGTLVTGGEDGVVRVWRPDTPRPDLELPVEGAGVTALAATWDDRWLLVGYDDRNARLWDLEGRRQVRVLEGHRRAVTAVALTSDGRRAVTGSHDGTARIWSCRTGATTHVLARHTGPITAVAFSKDGRVVLTASEDGRLCLWQRSSGELLEDVEVGGDGITAMAFSPDGRNLVLGGRDGSVRVWLVRWLWSALDDVVRSAEALFEPGAAPSLTWPGEDRDLDFWLDVWADLRRVGQGSPPSGPLGRRLGGVLARVRTEISARVPTPSSGVLGTAIGFGAAPTPPPTDGLADPLTVVGLVDAGLADALRQPGR